MSPNSKGTPAHFLQLIVAALIQEGIDPEESEHAWAREFFLKEHSGVIGVVRLKRGDTYRVIHMPVLHLPVEFQPFPAEAIQRLLTAVQDQPGAQYLLVEDALFMSQCRLCEALEQTLTTANEAAGGPIDAEMASGLELVEQIAEALEPICWLVFGALAVERLPNIRLTPLESDAVMRVLRQCSARVQEIYCQMMEGWAKLGFRVGISAHAIVLEGPAGPHPVGLATLCGGSPTGWPVVELAWQNQTRLEMDPGFSLIKMKNLLRAMHKQVQVRSEEIT